MPVLKIDDAEIYYETAGEGPPLLLIAGLAGDSQSWGPLRPHLEKRFTLVMPDNRACGRTKDGAKDGGDALTIEGMADDAGAVVDHLGLGRTSVIGHSMGVAISLCLAARRPDRVDRLVLAAGAAQTPARAASVVDTLLALRETGVDENSWYRAFFHWLFAPAFFDSPAAVEAAIAMSRAYPHAQGAGDMRRQIEAVHAFDAAAMPPISAPALLIAGGEDILVPPASVETTRTLLPEAQMTTLPGAGHSLHWDAPEAFARAAGDFLLAG